MPATFTSVATLSAGLVLEAVELADELDAFLAEVQPFVTVGRAAYLWDRGQILSAKLRLLGVDADDPIPGRTE